MEPLTMIGSGIVAVTALAAGYPKLKSYLDSRGTKPPHDHVRELIDYFTEKKCTKGIKASVDVGKLLYEQCTEHQDEENKSNNLP